MSKVASGGVRKQISGWVILQSPLKQSGIEFCQKQDEEFREILLNPPKYSWKCWPGFLLISYPNFPVFRLWNMPRRFQDQRLSLRGNQTKRWKRKGFCPRLHMEPVYPKSHPWNLCGAGTRRRRKLWLLSKPFIFYRCLGNLKGSLQGKNASTVLFWAMTVTSWFPSPLKFKLA